MDFAAELHRNVGKERFSSASKLIGRVQWNSEKKWKFFSALEWIRSDSGYLHINPIKRDKIRFQRILRYCPSHENTQGSSSDLYLSPLRVIICVSFALQNSYTNALIIDGWRMKELVKVGGEDEGIEKKTWVWWNDQISHGLYFMISVGGRDSTVMKNTTGNHAMQKWRQFILRIAI